MSVEIAGSVIAIAVAFIFVCFGIWFITDTIIEVIDKIRDRRHRND